MTNCGRLRPSFTPPLRPSAKYFKMNGLTIRDTRHPQKTPMNTDLANVRRHEMPDSCRLNFSFSCAIARDNRLMAKRMLCSVTQKSLNVMRHIPVALAPGY